jgi:glycosyltransferase involved in cell wall biosynthesis
MTAPSPTGASARPVISIVIPAYNCERFIPDTLRSIQEQTFSAWECVVIDDGSTDGTLALVLGFAAADPRIRVDTQPNAGPSSARNHGLQLLDPGSEYVIFMDSDDLWLPDALEALKAEAEKYPGCIGAQGVGRCVNQEGVAYIDPVYASNGKGRFVCDPLGRIVPLGAAEPTSFQSLWFSNPYPPGLILCRRDAYEKADRFDPNIFPMEDWDMLLRLSRHGDFRFVDKVVLSYRRHNSNLSVSTAAGAGRQIRVLLHKTFFSVENTPEQRGIVRVNWRAAQLLHLRQNLSLATENLARGRLKRSLSALVSAAVHLGRWIRGYPTLHSAWGGAASAREALRLAVGDTPTPKEGSARC